MPQETYHLVSLDDEMDDERGPNTVYAPPENMLSAAHLVTSRLRAAAAQHSSDDTGTYAILGGFSMQLRGGRQSTRDIDIVTSLSMRQVWDVITGVERIVIPDSRLVSGIIKVFVKTGQPWDSCPHDRKIEVDINQAGVMGSPRNLKDKTDTVGPFELAGQPLYFDVLDIPSMIKIKVSCCLSREEPRDFADVIFMITSHSIKVRQAIQGGIVDQDDVCEVLNHEKMALQSEGVEPKQLAALLGLDMSLMCATPTNKGLSSST